MRAMAELETVGGGTVLRAVGLLFGLAIAAPLIGIVMIPVAAVSSIARVCGSSPR